MKNIITLFDQLRNTENSKTFLSSYKAEITKKEKLFLESNREHKLVNNFCSKYLCATIDEVKEYLIKSEIYELTFWKIFCEKLLNDINHHKTILERISQISARDKQPILEKYKKSDIKYNILYKDFCVWNISSSIAPQLAQYDVVDLEELKIDIQNNFLTTINRFAEINLYDWVNISDSEDKEINFRNWTFVPKDEKIIIDQLNESYRINLYKLVSDFYKAETIKQKEKELFLLINDLEDEWSLNLNNEHDKYLMFDASDKGWWQQKKWSCNLIRHNNENPHHKRLDKLSEEEIKLTSWYKNSSDKEKTKFLIDILRFLLILKMYKTNPELELKEVFKSNQ